MSDPQEYGATERAARRSLSRDRAARGDHAARGRAEKALLLLLAAAVVGSVLAIGSVHLPVLLAASALAFSAAAIALYLQSAQGRGLSLPVPAWILVALAAYTWLQAAPLPLSWVASIAPLNADVWARALLPFGALSPSGAPGWASVSLDPGASTIEGLKWLVYAAIFTAAAVQSSRRGAALGITLVFVSAIAAAMTTIGHGLLGATRVFGLYQPTFGVSPWHVGPLLNPNNLAGYLNLGVMCGIGLLLMRRPTVPPWLTGLGIATIIAVELTSGSRAGALALLVGIAAMAVLPQRGPGTHTAGAPFRSKRFFLLVGAAVGGGAALAALGGTRETWAELYDQNIQKVEMLRWTAPMIRDHTWLGIGRGAFESVFPAYKVTTGNVVYTHAESFPMQWMSEWGAPVGIGAMLAFGAALSPWSFGARRSAVAAGAWVGLVVLLAQNLVDLALEIPAVCIALCAALGSVWGDARRRRLPRPERAAPGTAGPARDGRARDGHARDGRSRDGRSREGYAREDRSREDRSPEVHARWFHARSWDPRIAAGAPILVGLLAMAAAARFGWHDLAGDRTDLRASLAATDLRKHEERARLREELRAAILRRPAEPYFPLLGALIAWRGRDQDPLPWLSRTLERDPINGRAHLLLAEVLKDRGATAQALMELRLATENDSTLVGPAAQTALRWTRVYEELLRAVPAGKEGAAMLDELGVRLAAMGEPTARSLCDREAFARDPARIGPRLREALELIRGLSPGPAASLCADRAWCEREIEAHAAAIAAADPRTSLAAQIRARRLMAQGGADDAERMLQSECQRASDRPACLRLRVEVAAQIRAPDRLNAAVKDLLGAECSRAPSCAEAAAWAGSMRASRGEWGAATALFARATREDPSEAKWLLLADAAGRSGAHAQAADALERVAQKRGGADAALRKRIEEERSRAAGMLLTP